MKNIILIFSLLITTSCLAKTENNPFNVETIINTGEDVIWSLDFLPSNNSILVFSERGGQLKFVNLLTKKIQNISGVPEVFSAGQGGLLDIAFDKNDDLYFTYSAKLPKGKNTTALFKGKIDFTKNSLTGKTIFLAKAESSDGYHFGSRIVIDSDALYLGVGERNDRDKSQDLAYHHGKILKLTKEGKAYSTNPFIQQKNTLPEIYSYGHRNPQGLIKLQDGSLMNSEFGPRGGDELNLVVASKNYGWPVITYGKEYWGPKIGTTHKEGMEQPIHYWVPSISPSGIAQYQGEMFKEFNGHIFIANLSGQHLRRIVLKDQKVVEEFEYLNDLDERFRDVQVGPEGAIYTATDSGKILKLTKKK